MGFLTILPQMFVWCVGGTKMFMFNDYESVATVAFLNFSEIIFSVNLIGL